MSAALRFALLLAAVLVLLTVGVYARPVRRRLARWWVKVQTAVVVVAERVSNVLHKVDSAVIATSRPFRTAKPGPYRRWAAFLGWYALIYAAVAFAPRWVGLLALAWGLWEVLAINRAWVRNEKMRSKIAKKIDPLAADADPLAALEVGPTAVPASVGKVNDSYAPTPPASGERPAELIARMLATLRAMPDLRLMAFVAGLQLFALVPLLLELAHPVAGVFDSPAEVSYGQSLLAVLSDTYLKSVGDTAEVHLSDGAQRLVPVIKFAVYFLITLGAFRLLQIYEDIKEGVVGVRQDPDMAVLLGPRAVPRLLNQLDDPAVAPRVRENSLLALGRLRDARAVDALTRFATDHAQDARTRAAATLALGYLASPFAPPPGEQRPAPDSRTRAANGDIAAVLADLLRHDNCDVVRESAAIGLGMTDHPDAPTTLLDRVEEVLKSKTGGRVAESLPEVVKHLAQSLGERLGTAWPAAEGEPTDPAQVRRAVELLLHADGRDRKSSDPRDHTQGVHSLLRHRYLRVRNRAVRALGALGQPEAALPALLAVMNDNDNPKLLDVWAGVVGRLAAPLPADSPLRARAVDELAELLVRVSNGSVRRSAASSLGALATAHLDAVTRAAESQLFRALEEAYEMDDKDVQDTLHDTLAGPFGLRERADAVREKSSFDYLADQVDVAVGDGGLAARVAAAKRLQPLKDEGSLARLELLLAKPDLPAELRAVLEPLVKDMQRVVAEG